MKARFGSGFKGVACCLFLLAVTTSTPADADQLVVQLDRLTAAAADENSSGESAQPRLPLPPGLPRTLRLPLSTTADGVVTISLRQEYLDGSVEPADSPPSTRMRLLSPASGIVTEDATGKVAVGMEAALAFDEVATGKAKIFDVTIGGDADAGVAYGADLAIYVEAWRRGEDGEPLKERTKENRSFWGTLPGHFER